MSVEDSQGLPEEAMKFKASVGNANEVPAFSLPSFSDIENRLMRELKDETDEAEIERLRNEIDVVRYDKIMVAIEEVKNKTPKPKFEFFDLDKIKMMNESDRETRSNVILLHAKKWITGALIGASALTAGFLTKAGSDYQEARAVAAKAAEDSTEGAKNALKHAVEVGTESVATADAAGADTGIAAVDTARKLIDNIPVEHYTPEEGVTIKMSGDEMKKRVGTYVDKITEPIKDIPNASSPDALEKALDATPSLQDQGESPSQKLDTSSREALQNQVEDAQALLDSLPKYKFIARSNAKKELGDAKRRLANLAK